MSDKPAEVDDVQAMTGQSIMDRFLARLEDLSELDTEAQILRTDFAAAKKRLVEIESLTSQRRVELFSDLEQMDLRYPGNAGYERRMLTFLISIYKASR